MIQCIINGHKAYPISTSSIKVTYANQYVTDDGEYTYDITFPMSILANREIFKNVSRFEVKKKLAKYDDCKLYCNGLLIMSAVCQPKRGEASTLGWQVSHQIQCAV